MWRTVIYADVDAQFKCYIVELTIKKMTKHANFCL